MLLLFTEHLNCTTRGALQWHISPYIISLYAITIVEHVFRFSEQWHEHTYILVLLPAIVVSKEDLTVAAGMLWSTPSTQRCHTRNSSIIWHDRHILRLGYPIRLVEVSTNRCQSLTRLILWNILTHTHLWRTHPSWTCSHSARTTYM